MSSSDATAALALADALLALVELVDDGVPRQRAYQQTWDEVTGRAGLQQLPATYRHGTDCLRGLCADLLAGCVGGAAHVDSRDPVMALYARLAARLLWQVPTAERVVLDGMSLGPAAKRSIDEAAGWNRGRRGRSRGALDAQTVRVEIAASRADVAELVAMTRG